MSVLRMPDPLADSVAIAVLRAGIEQSSREVANQIKAKFTLVDRPNQPVGDRLTAGPWAEVEFVDG